jgi:hypothetical protein
MSNQIKSYICIYTDEGEVMIIKVERAVEGRPFWCLSDEEDFQSWKKVEGMQQKKED